MAWQDSEAPGMAKTKDTQSHIKEIRAYKMKMKLYFIIGNKLSVSLLEMKVELLTNQCSSKIYQKFPLPKG